ncbi:MAG: 4-hydroxy-tetrahydrodipicolinate synthase [Flavobacteriales bacterium]|jgi:4-hydroxy-tetrahydrodipicolinate synthase|nr:4-hydroxy-tetrahydrodipicolinate synthase [Flavobacteriales bacterium]
MSHKFKGVGVALVTPFTSDGKIDFKALTKLVELQLEGGTDFLVVQGTTGESPVLSLNEKMEVLHHVMEVNDKKLPLVYGLGGNNTMDVCNKLGELPKGIDGLLSVSPYYNKPLQRGIVAHYKAVSDHTDLPIILYNVPGRTSSNVSAETTLALAEIDNIVAMKEASGDFDQIMEIIKYKPDNFTVLSGDDAITLPLISIGVEGVISVVANALPERFSHMVHSGVSGDFATANEEHYGLMKMTRLMFSEGNPGGVKEALVYREICENHMRLPLVPVSDSLKTEIIKEMKVLMG